MSFSLRVLLFFDTAGEVRFTYDVCDTPLMARISSMLLISNPCYATFGLKQSWVCACAMCVHFNVYQDVEYSKSENVSARCLNNK